MKRDILPLMVCFKQYLSQAWGLSSDELLGTQEQREKCSVTVRSSLTSSLSTINYSQSDNSKRCQVLLDELKRKISVPYPLLTLFNYLNICIQHLTNANIYCWVFMIVNPQILSIFRKIVHCELILTCFNSSDNTTFICYSSSYYLHLDTNYFIIQSLFFGCLK